MIYLDRPNRALQVVLAGSVSANQWDITAHFFDQIPQSTTTLQRGGVQKSNSNNTTDVTIVDAVGQQGIVRNVRLITLHNKDTAVSTVTVKIDDSGSETILIKQAIAAGETLTYEDGRGFEILSPLTAPFVDTTALVRGSLDSTKLLRIEVDGLTTGTTRTWTALDADIVVAGSASALTANRFVWSTTGGLLTTDADATFDGTTAMFNTVDINGGAIDGTAIGAASRSTLQATSGDFSTTLSATGHVTFEGVTSTGATGTGNLVFSASPTFTGTITAAAANFSGAVTGTTVAWTKATAGDVITFTNGGATPKTGYFYSGANEVIFANGAGATNEGLELNRTSAVVKVFAGGTTVTTVSATGLSITGTLAVSGDVTLGDATADAHVINGQVTITEGQDPIIFGDSNFSGSADRRRHAIVNNYNAQGQLNYYVGASAGADPLAGTMVAAMSATGLGVFKTPTVALDVTGAALISSTLGLSGALTYGGVTLSNSVTGTGSMVLSASPTFSGNPGGTITSGTYTPTITGVANVAGSTSAVCQYMRVGDVVTVSGQVLIDPTAAVVTSFRLSLPIASNFAITPQCGGAGGFQGTTIDHVDITADITNNEAFMAFIASVTTNSSVNFIFTYLIV